MPAQENNKQHKPSSPPSYQGNMFLLLFFSFVEATSKPFDTAEKANSYSPRSVIMSLKKAATVREITQTKSNKPYILIVQSTLTIKRYIFICIYSKQFSVNMLSMLVF